jgi:hypothetical protein
MPYVLHGKCHKNISAPPPHILAQKIVSFKNSRISNTSATLATASAHKPRVKHTQDHLTTTLIAADIMKTWGRRIHYSAQTHDENTRMRQTRLTTRSAPSRTRDGPRVPARSICTIVTRRAGLTGRTRAPHKTHRTSTARTKRRTRAATGAVRAERTAHAARGWAGTRPRRTIRSRVTVARARARRRRKPRAGTKATRCAERRHAVGAVVSERARHSRRRVCTRAA